MALLVGTLFARITADDTEYQRTMRGVDRSAQQTEGVVTRSSRAMGAAIAASFTGAAIFAGIKRIIMAASDLSESANGVSVTFGAAADTIFKFAKGAADAMGQSETQARQGAVTFGIYGKQAGLAGEQLSAFSIEMVKLASDMASFRNTSPEEAIEALGAAFRGESDPIEQYGVLLSEAVLQQRALQMGVIKTTSEALTPQQRVLVAYSEILAQTKDAQGDFARTNGEFANQLRILQARFENAAAAAGGRLLPAAQAAIGWLSGPGLSAVGAVVDGVLDVVDVLMSAARAFGDLPGPVQAGIVALVAWRLMQDRITAGTGVLGQRLVEPWRRYGDEVRVQTALAAAEGNANISRLAAGYAVLESRLPVLAQMRDAYTSVSTSTRAWAEQQHALTAASGPVASTLRGALPAVQGFGSAALGAAAAVGSGLRSAVSGLVGVLGGPWGVAITAAVVLIGTWISKSQQAKQRQDDLANAGRNLAKAIREQNGVITENIRAQAAKDLEDQKLLPTARQLGVSLSQLNSAYLGNSDAMARVKSQIQGIIDANTTVTHTYNPYTGAVSKSTTSVTEQGKAAQGLLSDLERMTGGLREGEQAQGRIADATFDVNKAIADQKGNTSALGEAMQSMAKLSGTAEDRIKGLKDALDELAGDQYSMEEATQAVNDALRELGDAVKEARGEATKTQPWIDAAGAINTTTKAGSDLQNKVMELGEAHRQQFAAVMDTALAHKKTMPEAMVEAVRASEATRSKLIETAKAAGASKDEAIRLADRYAALPANVATQIQQPGMTQSILDAIGLKGRYLDIPGYKWTTISSSSPEQIRLLEILGYKVEHLPNGNVRIIANTEAASAAVDRFIRDQNGRIITIKVQTNTGSAYMPLGGGARYQATGQVMEYYAAGGLRPMSAASAAIVGSYRRTGVQRVIGDNPRYDEGFVPLNPQSARSQSILSDIIRRMRPDLYQLMTRGAVPMAEGGIWAAGNGIPAQRDGGRSFNVGGITINTNRGVTARELRDALYEYEVLYG